MVKKMRAKKKPLQTLGRALFSNDGISQTDLCLATGFPPWKISRLVKRLEILGFVEVEPEPRLNRGRPRRLCKLTTRGVDYFRGLLKSGKRS